jgi:PadR family transcriptional regulator PadR
MGRRIVPGKANGRKKSCRHVEFPCICAMGNVYRFVEPVVLLLLKRKGRSYGYDLGNELEAHAITDGKVERAALYRTLRTLEANGNVFSEWEPENTGPARRVYTLTKNGEQHLKDWVIVLGHVSESMKRFVAEAAEAIAAPRQKEAHDAVEGG